MATSMTFNYYKILLFLFFLPLLLSKDSSANVNYAWQFDREDALNGWSGEGARFAFFKQNGLVRIEGGKQSMLISPPELNLPMNRVYFLKIRLRSSADANGFVLLRPKNAFSFLYNFALPFNIESGAKFHDYSVNISVFLPPETILDQFSLAFTGENTIDINSIEVYVPSFVELSWYNLKQGFSSEEIIGGVTINTVTTPMIGKISLPAFLCSFAFILALGVIIFKRRFAANEIRKAFIISFLCAAFIFALRMDYNWIRILKKDTVAFSDTDITKRIAMLERSDFYDFISIAKTLIPPNKMALTTTESGADYFAIKGKYYLLPIKTSKNGDYVVVYRNNAITLDTASKTLSKDGKTIATNVEMVYNFNNYGFIYRITKKNG